MGKKTIAICLFVNLGFALSLYPILEVCKTGRDYGDCSTEPVTSPCKSINYAYNCLLGDDINNASNTQLCSETYNGTGTIKVAIGEFNMSSSLVLKSNQQQIIQGEHATNTTIIYISNKTRLSWFDCNTQQCYFTFANVTMLFEFTTSVSSVEPNFIIFGTMQFVNVVFDGNNQSITFKGMGYSEVIFINCTFINNNAKYRFQSIAVKIINSTFSNNKITTNLNLINDEDGLIIVDYSSTVHIISCLFENSYIIRRPLLSVYDGSLVIENSEFRNITGYVNHTNPRLYNVYVPHRSIIFKTSTGMVILEKLMCQ